MKQLVIIGASGHGKVVADIAAKNGYDTILFLDDNESLTTCGGRPVAGKSSRWTEFDCDFSVAIGNPQVRERLVLQLEQAGKHLPPLIHPGAILGERTEIGSGTVIAPVRL